MSKNLLCWTDIPVANLERSMAFYTAVLGSPVSKQTGPGYEFAVLPHAGESASGCLTALDDVNAPSRTGPLIYLSVEGRLDAAVEAVKSHGGTVLEEKHQIGPYGFRAVIVDSEGNRIALHSPTA